MGKDKAFQRGVESVSVQGISWPGFPILGFLLVWLISESLSLCSLSLRAKYEHIAIPEIINVLLDYNRKGLMTPQVSIKALWHHQHWTLKIWHASLCFYKLS